MNKKFTYFIIFILLIIFNINHCNINIFYTEKELNEYIEENNLKNLTNNEIIYKLAIFFANKKIPYETIEFEVWANNRKIENYNKFPQKMDCVTFVETVIALTIMIKNNIEIKEENFESIIKDIRYDEPGNEESFILHHYFELFIKRNCGRNILEEITKKLFPLSCDITKKNICFYSSRNQDGKFDLAKNDIEKVEKELNETFFYYIKSEHVKNIEKDIPNGSLITFTFVGDDVYAGHAGIIIKDNEGKCLLIHATSVGEKCVSISKETLSEYLEKKKHLFNGIILFDIK
jgi:hypothetical protein